MNRGSRQCQEQSFDHLVGAGEQRADRLHEPQSYGVRAAALAGLAITPLPASAIVARLRVLGVESGLPVLPALEFAIFERERPDAADRQSGRRRVRLLQ